MEWVEGEGKTEDEAIDNAMKKLGALSRDEIRTEIIGEEKKFFGFGEKKIKVRVVFNELPATQSVGMISETAEILRSLLRGMGIDAKVEGEEREDTIYLTILSQFGGILIGRRGETLNSLELLVDRIANRKFQGRVNIIVDTENYREKRRKKLDMLAKRLAGEVRRKGKPSVIGSMNARDRKIIHMALKDDEEVETMSEGEGFERKVIISPKSRSQKSEVRSQNKNTSRFFCILCSVLCML